METEDTPHPSCFGNLDIVFPKRPDGLRHSADKCFKCSHKTECLKTAMEGKAGLKLKEELVDKAYDSGGIGFFERWVRKKDIKTKIKKGESNQK